MVAVKLCGLSNESDVKTAVELDAAYIGFVFFAPSPRNVVPEHIAGLVALIPHDVKKVAVVVDPSDELLEEVIDHVEPDFFQLHGNETVERVSYIKQTFGVPVIKAFSVQEAEDVIVSNAYSDCCEMFLFDAKAPAGVDFSGGHGQAFEWSLLSDQDISKPWMLSGGLNSDNVMDAVSQTGAMIIDVSSGLEHEKGVKDVALMKEFMATVGSI